PNRETPDSLPRAVDHDAIRRQREHERAARQRATLAARAFYEGCAPLRGGHPYFEAHGLDMNGCEGLRVAEWWPAWDAVKRQRVKDYREGGWLVIPCLRGGQITSLQGIAHDGDKKF